MMIEKIQKIANLLLEKTPYRVYTVSEINEGLHKMGEFDSDFEEDPNLLIFCADEEHTNIEIETWHPGFMIKLFGGLIESWSIVSPGPVYKSTNIDEAIKSMLAYMDGLECPNT